jgi:DNA (cytosine-5)-methyltransferase 1
MLKHASLFSGIGGFDLAAQWMGWENVFHCEWNEFARRILKYYWKNAISYGDITQTSFKNGLWQCNSASSGPTDIQSVNDNRIKSK